MTPAFKQTEIGATPEDWALTTLGTLLSFTNGLNADKTAYGKGMPFINVMEPITRSHIYGPEIPGRVQIPSEAALAYLVKPGDIVFNRTSETDSELGLAAVYLGDERVVFGGFVIRGRPITDALDPKYSGYALRTKTIRSQIISMGQGAIRANIGQQNLQRVLVVVPPKCEQRAIAQALGDVDALIAVLDRLIAKKRDIKQATMQQLLTGKTRLPGFSGKWEVKQLGDVVQIKKGQLITSSTLKQGDIPVIAGGKQPAYYHASANRFGRTITISASGASAGYVALYNYPIFASDCSTISESESYSLDFIYYQLLSMQQTIYKSQTGGAQPHIHAKDLTPLTALVPSMPEQVAIAAVLSDMDAELFALEARRDKTRALKQGMMQELLTGKTRLI